MHVRLWFGTYMLIGFGDELRMERGNCIIWVDKLWCWGDFWGGDVKREPEIMYVRMFMAVYAWLWVYIFKAMVLNIVCFYISMNGNMQGLILELWYMRMKMSLHEVEMRHLSLKIWGYCVKLFKSSLGKVRLRKWRVKGIVWKRYSILIFHWSKWSLLLYWLCLILLFGFGWAWYAKWVSLS